MSGVLVVNGGADVGDDAGGSCGAKGNFVHWQMYRSANVGNVELELDRGSIRKGVNANMTGLEIVSCEEQIDQLGKYTHGPIPRKN